MKEQKGWDKMGKKKRTFIQSNPNMMVQVKKSMCITI